jgi:hypothetical protein
MGLQSIGFGLTVGWMWLVFLDGPVLNALTQRWAWNTDFCLQLYLLTTALVLSCHNYRQH